jgi:hypothetical protein
VKEETKVVLARRAARKKMFEREIIFDVGW